MSEIHSIFFKKSMASHKNVQFLITATNKIIVIDKNQYFESLF